MHLFLSRGFQSESGILNSVSCLAIIPLSMIVGQKGALSMRSSGSIVPCHVKL